MTLLAATLPAHIRTRAEVRATFARNGLRTSIARAHETGGLRLRFPRTAPGCEAVIINTGGGIAGGDHYQLAFEAGTGSQVTLTTQAAEKVYRAQANAARVDVQLVLGANAHLDWLPQETILFDQAALRRTLTVEMAADARLTLVESLIFGRLAMGEAAVSVQLHDSWRIKRGGKLIFAEELAVDGPARQCLDHPALGGGARAMATVLHVTSDAHERLESVRASLAVHACEAGASTWNNMLLVRAACASPERLRAAIVGVLRVLRGQDVPRVWQS